MRAVSETFGGQLDGTPKPIAPKRGCVLYTAAVRIAKKGILGEKYNDIKNLVNEYNLPWEDAYLEFMPIASLLGEPVEVLAGQIRQHIESK